MKQISRVYSTYSKKHISSLPTPSILLDLNTLNKNVANHSNLLSCANQNIKVRHHTEWHRTFQIAELLLKPTSTNGAIAVSRISDALFYEKSKKFSNIFYNNPITQDKLYDANYLNEFTNFCFEVDCDAQLRMIRHFVQRNSRSKFSILPRISVRDPIGLDYLNEETFRFVAVAHKTQNVNLVGLSFHHDERKCSASELLSVIKSV
ncbi:hypothetical protein AKO1_004279, partial [Acrasis kona]